MKGPLKWQFYPEQLQLWQNELTGNDQKDGCSLKGEPKSSRPSLACLMLKGNSGN